VWGATFVSSKVLLNNGMSPSGIFFIRFSIAYLFMWLLNRKIFAQSFKDEMLLLLLGITGGSVYFLAENEAIRLTYAYNVAIILGITPLITAISISLFFKQIKLTKKLLFGSLLAILGIVFVVMNGHFVLKISPKGDILTLAAAIVWGIYTVIFKVLENKYPLAFITRKIFFYGILTIFPVILLEKMMVPAGEQALPSFQFLTQPLILFNLLFLGIVASLLCYLIWNFALKKLGVITTSNYLYFIPIITLITSYVILDEKITFVAIAGILLITAGVYWAERKT
jgi:drug/metabolite transporter (DMT)-like permease